MKISLETSGLLSGGGHERRIAGNSWYPRELLDSRAAQHILTAEVSSCQPAIVKKLMDATTRHADDRGGNGNWDRICRECSHAAIIDDQLGDVNRAA